jgi:hypothetical protein
VVESVPVAGNAFTTGAAAPRVVASTTAVVAVVVATPVVGGAAAVVGAAVVAGDVVTGGATVVVGTVVGATVVVGRVVVGATVVVLDVGHATLSVSVPIGFEASAAPADRTKPNVKKAAIPAVASSLANAISGHFLPRSGEPDAVNGVCTHVKME